MADIKASNGTMSKNIVQVEIANEEKFIVHRDLLCYCSPKFQAALDGRVEEQAEGRLELDDVDQRTLNIFLEWLYFEKLPEWKNLHRAITHDHRGAGSKATRKRVGKGKAKAEIGGSQSEGNDSGEASSQPNFDEHYNTQPEAELISLYTFADKYDVAALIKDLIDKLRSVDPINRGLPSFTVVMKAYDSLPHNSPLCRYLLNIYVASYRAHNHSCTCIECYYMTKLPHDFLVPLMTAMSRKRKRICVTDNRSEFGQKPFSTPGESIPVLQSCKEPTDSLRHGHSKDAHIEGTISNKPPGSFSGTIPDNPPEHFAGTIPNNPLREFSGTISNDPLGGFAGTIPNNPLGGFSATIPNDPLGSFAGTILNSPLGGFGGTIPDSHLGDYAGTISDNLVGDFAGTMPNNFLEDFSVLTKVDPDDVLENH